MGDHPGFEDRPRDRGRSPARERPFFSLKAAAIAGVAVPAFEALGATYEWLEAGTEHLTSIQRAGQTPIYALWHGRIMPGVLYLRDRGIVVMTSENFDGEWIARVIRRFGFTPARGSTSRGGSRALVEMRRELRAGRAVAFTLDGPRGPREVAQPGAVWLAGATGQPILPFHIEAERSWTLRSWDRHQIPRPGSRVAAVIGSPITIERDASPAAIAAGCRDVERALTGLRDVARNLVAVRGAHERGDGW